MIQRVDMYEAKCDNCGKSWEHWHHGWTCLPDINSVEENLDEHNWHTVENGVDKHYCPDCFTIDENDNFVLKSIDLTILKEEDHG